MKNITDMSAPVKFIRQIKALLPLQKRNLNLKYHDPVVPCGCGQRTGTVRRALRDLFAELEREHPHLKETMLSAMGNVDTSRLLDTRFLNPDGEGAESETQTEKLFPIVTEL